MHSGLHRAPAWLALGGRRPLQLLKQFLARDARVAHQPAQEPGPQFAVHRNGHEQRPLRVLVGHVAPFAALGGEPTALEEPSEALATGAGKWPAQTSTATRSSSTAGSGWPSARSASRWLAIASRAFAIASSRLSPCVWQPGRLGTETT
jgi:hypothetical protein